ncbi:MAG: cytidylate kinase [Desulfobulbus propionicus]|nr:MAG: cytidylate kinase [Desulfobulbus propionicus]PIE60429.1 MAG: cytidylate kinase [Desulfobulbus propionicus]
MSKVAVVAIDGPSGVGKSTVSRGLAAKLGFTYLDTGAMYRAVGFACQQYGIDCNDEQQLADLLRQLQLELLPAVDDGDVQVLVDGNEVGHLIRTPEMGMVASVVSALPPVREHLTALQQKMGAAGKIVAEGRDTGTVVFPQAHWKFYLDAQPEIRMQRRARQLREKGETVDEQELLMQIMKRDKADSERAIAPLKQASDAVYIDSSDKPVEEIIQLMFERVKG